MQSDQRETSARAHRLGHDIMNQLNIVVGNASLLELEDLTPDMAQSVEDIQAAGTRAVELTKQLVELASDPDEAAG